MPRATTTCGRRTTSRNAPAAAPVLDHDARRVVLVSHHDHARLDARVQVRQQMALAERGQQKVLGIPPAGIAAERLVRRGEQGGLAVDLDGHGPVVVPIAARAGAAIAGPGGVQGVPVLAEHSPSLTRRAAAVRGGRLASCRRPSPPPTPSSWPSSNAAASSSRVTAASAIVLDADGMPLVTAGRHRRTDPPALEPEARAGPRLPHRRRPARGRAPGPRHGEPFGHRSPCVGRARHPGCGRSR